MAKALLGTWCREALGRWGWDGTGWDVPGFRMALARPWDRSRAGVVAQTCSVLPPAAEMPIAGSLTCNVAVLLGRRRL